MTRQLSAYEVRTQFGEVLDRVRYTQDPCVIHRHGKPVAVIMDYGSFQATQRLQHAQSLPTQYQSWMETLVQKIVKGYKPEKIILFGSAAQGKLRAGSDIDLCIIKRTRKRRLDRSDDILPLIPSEIPVDLVVYTPEEWGQKYRTGDVMVKEIHDSGKILYDRKK